MSALIFLWFVWDTCKLFLSRNVIPVDAIILLLTEGYVAFLQSSLSKFTVKLTEFTGKKCCIFVKPSDMWPVGRHLHIHVPCNKCLESFSVAGDCQKNGICMGIHTNICTKLRSVCLPLVCLLLCSHPLVLCSLSLLSISWGEKLKLK